MAVHVLPKAKVDAEHPPLVMPLCHDKITALDHTVLGTKIAKRDWSGHRLATKLRKTTTENHRKPTGIKNRAFSLYLMPQSKDVA